VNGGVSFTIGKGIPASLTVQPFLNINKVLIAAKSCDLCGD